MWDTFWCVGYFKNTLGFIYQLHTYWCQPSCIYTYIYIHIRLLANFKWLWHSSYGLYLSVQPWTGIRDIKYWVISSELECNKAFISWEEEQKNKNQQQNWHFRYVRNPILPLFLSLVSFFLFSLTGSKHYIADLVLPFFLGLRPV